MCALFVQDVNEIVFQILFV